MRRVRAIVALRLIRIARRLLNVPQFADEDFEHCGFCGEEGNPADHKDNCPCVTDVWTVTLQEMWPHGPAVCEGCGTTLWPGERYSHIPLAENVGQVACLGCVAHSELQTS